MPEKVDASPTKRFFIEMLTRDIELGDAILDLLDNCIDGAIRVGEARGTDSYHGFEAKMNIDGTTFTLVDNCGGIPKDLAINYAFRMGRPKSELHALSKTVGVYGIGMKRAIFKIGRNAEVISKTPETCYKVCIDDDWTRDEGDWKLNLIDIPEDSISELSENGTMIKVTDLNETVSNLWSKEYLETFLSELRIKIRNSFSLIIEKGFAIYINDEEIRPEPIIFLLGEEKNGSAIEPYYATKDYHGVTMTLIVGLYGSPVSMDEIDNASEKKRATADAGITVVCNDRVVLYNDKTHLTGWGDAGVPKYHTQFVGIRGILTFESDDPEKLPMTTTKRGVDLSSPIYADAKNYMRDALTKFTSYTNRWKGRNTEERKYSKAATQKNASEVEMALRSKLKQTRGREGAKVYSPNLPKPKDERPYKVIHYTKPKTDIDYLEHRIFDDDSLMRKPSEIGEKCFDLVIEHYRGYRGEEKTDE